jgi:hypothetical protein
VSVKQNSFVLTFKDLFRSRVVYRPVRHSVSWYSTDSVQMLCGSTGLLEASGVPVILLKEKSAMVDIKNL